MALFIKIWLITAAVILPIDLVWLKSMRWFYEREMGAMLLASPRIVPAVVFYLGYAAAVAFFVVMPQFGKMDWKAVAFAGAFLGFAAYGTYDGTNYATLKDFPLSVTIVDWAWGTIMTAVTGTIAWFVANRLLSGG